MKPIYFLAIATILLSCSTGEEPTGCFPADKLPDHITPLSSFGQRSEWSLDGEKIYFVDSAGGDAWVVDINTNKTKKITKPSFRPAGHGYYRVICLSNGDLLLTCGPARRETYIQIMDKSMKKPPVTLNESINEGPAVSRKTMKIAWSPNHVDIWTGEIVYHNGIPEITDKNLIIENTNVIVDSIKYEDILEPQNWHPPLEEELIWSQYGKTSQGLFTAETFGYDMNTGEIINHSKTPDLYDEPEGIFPDGIYTLVESDRHNPKGTSNIDIYKLKLDGTGQDYTRITFFNEVTGFRSSNPVIRDDGRYMAFQASISGTDAGVGCGIYLFDFEKFKE